MLKETPRSLRTFLGIVAVLNFLMWAAAVDNVILLLRAKSTAHLSPLYIVRAFFALLMAILLAWITVKFNTLITEKTTTIRNILHLNFWGSVSLAVIYGIFGVTPNILGRIVSIVLYVYLLNSVQRISKELLEKKIA